MLRKVTVNNFKSLINVTYEPRVVHLLIGVNNSGKTNLCQALRLLSQMARKQLLSSDLPIHWMNWTIVKNVYFGMCPAPMECKIYGASVSNLDIRILIDSDYGQPIYSPAMSPDGVHLAFIKKLENTIGDIWLATVQIQK